MKPLDYSLLNKKGVVRKKQPAREYPPIYCFGGRTRKLCADDEVNDYLNTKIKEAMAKLDEKK